MLAGWSDVKRAVAGLIRLSAIPPLLVVAFVVCAQRARHALTCSASAAKCATWASCCITSTPHSTATSAMHGCSREVAAALGGVRGTLFSS